MTKINPIYLVMMLIGLSALVLAGTITITLNSPTNNSVINGRDILFNSTIGTTVSKVNTSLWHNSTGTWHRNQTLIIFESYSNESHNGSSFAAQPSDTAKTGVEINITEIGDWALYLDRVYVSPSATATTIYLQDSSGVTLTSAPLVGTKAVFNNYSLENRTIYRVVGDAGGASFTQGNGYTPSSLPLTKTFLNYSATFLNDGARNTGGNLFMITEIHVVNGTKADEAIFYNNLTDGGIWGTELCDSDGVCGFSTNFSFTIGFFENSKTYNSTTYQTKAETIVMNITSSATPTAKLYLNNSDQGSATITSYAGNNYILSKTIDINASVSGNTNFYYEVTTNSQKANSSIDTINIIPTFYDYCNSTLTQKYFNISFKDESTTNFVKAQIPTSTTYYWLGSGTQRKTLSYSNTTEGFEFNFCSNAVNESVYIAPYIQYKNTTDYPQRIFNTSQIQTYNYTTNRTLYLLNSADGIYVTFQVINLAEQPISGVSVNATRTIDGELVILGEGTTGDDGTITFWLNPDFSHNFAFLASGYDLYTTTITPTQTSYTISLGGAQTPPSDFTQGVSYTIRPTQDFLDNSTIYSFNYSLSSSYWTVEEFGFLLYWGNGSLIDSTSSSANGGIVNINNINTSQNATSIYMNYYYVVDSNYTNGTRSWYIQPYYGRSFSLWHFFEDLESYLSANLFGFDNFGKILLSVLILILATGVLSMRYGISSEASIMGIMFGIVLFLDYGIGLIPQITIGGITAMAHLPSFLMFIILIAMIIKEERG